MTLEPAPELARAIMRGRIYTSGDARSVVAGQWVSLHLGTRAFAGGRSDAPVTSAGRISPLRMRSEEEAGRRSQDARERSECFWAEAIFRPHTDGENSDQEELENYSGNYRSSKYSLYPSKLCSYFKSQSKIFG